MNTSAGHSELSSSLDCMGHFQSELERFRCFLRAQTEAANVGDFARIARIKAELDRRYRRIIAPLIVDLMGFTNMSRRLGIIGAMAAVQEVWDAIKAAVTTRNGIILKDEADTFYALLPNVSLAIGAAIEVQDRLDQLNQRIHEQRGEHAPTFLSSAGIGFGETYQIGTEDAFGQEVNLAYNAGENMAEAGEILLTRSANKALDHEGLPVGVSRVQEVPYKGYSLWKIHRTSPSSFSLTHR